MIELDLLGVGADGQSLVFTDTNGERYSVQITDELRGAVRRDRPAIAPVTSPGTTLRPRDIQSLLRAGASAEEIARNHGMEVAQVLRYEGPVSAEKDFALRRALDTPIGEDTDSLLMGDLVVDRLAARGVDPSTLTWSARREGTAPWQICLTFVQGATERGALWTLNNGGGIEAIDQEARWLTETVDRTPSASVFTPMPPKAPAPVADDEDLRQREMLLDQLNAARGRREEIDIPSEFDDADEEDTNQVPLRSIPAPQDPVPEREMETRPVSISARIHEMAQARGVAVPTASGGDDPEDIPIDPDSEASSPAPPTLPRGSAAALGVRPPSIPPRSAAARQTQGSTIPAVKGQENQADTEAATDDASAEVVDLPPSYPPKNRPAWMSRTSATTDEAPEPSDGPNSPTGEVPVKKRSGKVSEARGWQEILFPRQQ